MEILLRELGHSWLGRATHSQPYLFSACAALHFIGLCLLVGALVVMDLHVLGFIKRVNYAATLRLTPVAVIGLTINVLTGLVMVASKPLMYWHSAAFKLKMIFVLVGALNAGWFLLVEHRRIHALEPGARPPWTAKLPAALSLGSWLAVILIGRTLFVAVGGG